MTCYIFLWLNMVKRSITDFIPITTMNGIVQTFVRVKVPYVTSVVLSIVINES